MSKFELHCLYWDNANPEMVQLHRDCLSYLGVELTYTNKTVGHGLWLDRLARGRLDDLDAIGFIDIDCLPHSAAAVAAAFDHAIAAGSFIGLAQAANHITPPLPVYAAPAFLVISRDAFRKLGRPNLRSRGRLDVAQDLSRTADARGFPYRVLYPIGFNRSPEGGPWRLGNYGWYGIGTEYNGGFFHLFESRFTTSLDLFRAKAEAIMAGAKQLSSAPISSVDLTFAGSRSAATGNGSYGAIRQLLRRI